MTTPVNPPPQLRIPKQFLSDPQTREYFRQTEVILFQLWQRTGGAEDNIEDAITQFNISLASAIEDIKKRLGSGIPFTVDTTGITVDRTIITTDKSEQ